MWTVDKRYLNENNYIDKIFAENPFQTESTDLLIEMAVSDKEAKKLKLTASQRKSTKGAIKITKPDSKKML